MQLYILFQLLLLSLPFSLALSLPSDSSRRSPDHVHINNKRLPSSWYHPPDHPVHSLFKRGLNFPRDDTDGIDYAPVGSPTWSAAYPQSSPDITQLPSQWVNALNAAVNAGLIPNIPVSSNLPNQNPTYPTGFDPNGPIVCSATYKCRSPGDIWDAPDGYFGTGFDDGPLPASTALYQFLQEKNESSTHFMIGVNILNFPTEFSMAFDTLGADIAVHTYTHPYMTTLSNLQVLAQFGWSMEIIHNSTGGRLPRFWRPPYGDSDNRVRAIAKEVFGLTAIIWNQDTADWSITTGGTTSQAVNASLTKWLTGPKSPGLIVLEHELTPQSVQCFIDAYPVIKANGWNMLSTTELGDADPYQNSAGADSTVTLANQVIVVSTTSSSASSSSSSASTTSIASKASSSPSASTAAHSNGDVSSWKRKTPWIASVLLSIMAAMVLLT